MGEMALARSLACNLGLKVGDRPVEYELSIYRARNMKAH